MFYLSLSAFVASANSVMTRTKFGSSRIILLIEKETQRDVFSEIKRQTSVIYRRRIRVREFAFRTPLFNMCGSTRYRAGATAYTTPPSPLPPQASTSVYEYPFSSQSEANICCRHALGRNATHSVRNAWGCLLLRKGVHWGGVGEDGACAILTCRGHACRHTQPLRSNFGRRRLTKISSAD